MNREKKTQIQDSFAHHQRYKWDGNAFKKSVKPLRKCSRLLGATTSSVCLFDDELAHCRCGDLAKSRASDIALIKSADRL
jgi:hypothetical protein